jgi:hypothetical protein
MFLTKVIQLPKLTFSRFFPLRNGSGAAKPPSLFVVFDSAAWPAPGSPRPNAALISGRKPRGLTSLRRQRTATGLIFPCIPSIAAAYIAGGWVGYEVFRRYVSANKTLIFRGMRREIPAGCTKVPMPRSACRKVGYAARRPVAPEMTRRPLSSNRTAACFARAR